MGWLEVPKVSIFPIKAKVLSEPLGHEGWGVAPKKVGSHLHLLPILQGGEGIPLDVSPRVLHEDALVSPVDVLDHQVVVIVAI